MEKETKYVNGVFEQPWWLDVVAKGSWDTIIIEENYEIIARWPYVFKKYFFFRQIRMPRLTQTLGIWLKPVDGTECEKLSHQKNVIVGLIEKIPKTIYFKIHTDYNFKYFLPFFWNGFTIKPLITYRINELTNLDKVYSDFDKTAKKNIRSAEKKVRIVDDLNIEVLIDMLETTFKAQNRKSPYPSELIRNIDFACKQHNAGKFLAAVDSDGNVHACSYFIFDTNTCYYLISGSNPKYRTSGAQSLIIWEAIKFASKVSEKFDFEGSMIEGIEKFFRQFGGSPTIFYQISKIPIAFGIIEFLKPSVKKILHYK